MHINGDSRSIYKKNHGVQSKLVEYKRSSEGGSAWDSENGAFTAMICLPAQNCLETSMCITLQEDFTLRNWVTLAPN